MPETVALHETVAVPDPVMVVGLIVPQARPDGALSVRETMPLKRLADVMVIVDVAEDPALRGAGEDADVLKSQNWKSVVVEWTNWPLVPVRVSV